MHAERDLEALAAKLSRRMMRLRQAIRAQNARYDAQKGVYLGHVAIEAANTWTVFARSALISSAFGARTAGGTRVTSPRGSWSNEADVIVDATLIVKPFLGQNGRPAVIARRHEPTWHDANELERMWMGLQLSNASTVSQALSLNARFLVDLPPVRNYFAHKNKRSMQVVADIARDYGISPITPFTGRRRSAVELVTAAPPGRPQSVIEDWLDELDTTAVLMAS